MNEILPGPADDKVSGASGSDLSALVYISASRLLIDKSELNAEMYIMADGISTQSWADQG